MNPPFSATPGVERIRHDADLRHLRSAFSMLPPGGRLAAITSAHCVPGDAAWRDAFDSVEGGARTVFTMAIDGRAYARRGTGFDTRLTVIERSSAPGIAIDREAKAADAGALLDAVIARVEPRLPIGPHPVRSVPAGPARDLFGKPVAAAGHEAPHRAPIPPPHPQPSMTGDPSPSSPSRPAFRTLPPPQAIRLPRPMPAPTIRGGRARCGCRARSSIRRRWCSPPPWRRCRIPCRHTGRCCPNAWSTDGLLSDAQLESIVLAGEAHARHLAADYRIGAGWETVQRCPEEEDGDGDDGSPDPTDVTDDGEVLSAPVRFRRGWMLGDGTGAGKGRQVAAIVLDHWLRGRKRALWLSQSDKLVEDARRDWCALGGREDDVIALGRFRQGAEIPLSQGILFATYATLRSPARQGKTSRLDQIVAWLAGSLGEDDRHGFDGR